MSKLLRDQGARVEPPVPVPVPVTGLESDLLEEAAQLLRLPVTALLRRGALWVAERCGFSPGEVRHDHPPPVWAPRDRGEWRGFFLPEFTPSELAVLDEARSYVFFEVRGGLVDLELSDLVVGGTLRLLRHLVREGAHPGLEVLPLVSLERDP